MKPRKAHEIHGALKFDEGGVDGAWIDDEAQVSNGAWIGGEMEDQACRRWVSDERGLGEMGWRHGTATWAMIMKIGYDEDPKQIGEAESR